MEMDQCSAIFEDSVIFGNFCKVSGALLFLSQKKPLSQTKWLYFASCRILGEKAHREIDYILYKIITLM